VFHTTRPTSTGAGGGAWAKTPGAGIKLSEAHIIVVYIPAFISLISFSYGLDSMDRERGSFDFLRALQDFPDFIPSRNISTKVSVNSL
jgi:hypothetical protein